MERDPSLIDDDDRIVDLLDPKRRTIDPMIDVAAETRTATDTTPWIYSNMIQSADGGTAVDGLSGPLGGPADVAMLLALRARADVILVGAATASGEGYGPPNPSPETIAVRRSRGQTDRPLVCVVSGSLSISTDEPLFRDPSYRPLILTGADSPDDRRSALETVADIIVAGEERVDLRLGISELAQRGHRVILLEGGPRLNGQFVAEGLIDEWNVTISPTLIGGSAARPAHGSSSDVRHYRLARLWKGGDLLFCRYLKS